MGKAVNSYVETLTVANKNINVLSKILPLSNKGPSPLYIIANSAGERLVNYNLGVFSKFKQSSKELRFYVRDENRLVNSTMSYNFSTSGTPYSSLYTTCTATTLKSNIGCLMRFSFNYSNKTAGVYLNTVIMNGLNLLHLEGNINESNPYSQSPKYAFIDNSSGKILTTVEVASEMPSATTLIKNFYIKDLNESTFPVNIGLSLNQLTAPLTISYNQCTNSRSILNTSESGCMIKISASMNQPVGEYIQNITSNTEEINTPLVLNVLGNSCTPGTSQSCNIANGQGTQQCNELGTSYGSCMLNTCNTDYHLE